MGVGNDGLAIVQAFLDAIVAGDEDAMMRLLDPQVRRTEHPNRIVPQGRVQGLVEMREGFKKGRGLLARQSYEVLSAVAADERVAVQMTWRGTLAVALGTLEAGDEMVAHCAMFTQLRSGRIVAIDNYDCFAPF